MLVPPAVQQCQFRWYSSKLFCEWILMLLYYLSWFNNPIEAESELLGSGWNGGTSKLGILTQGKSTMSPENDKTCLGKVMWGQLEIWGLGTWNRGARHHGRGANHNWFQTLQDYIIMLVYWFNNKAGKHYKITFLSIALLYLTIFHSNLSEEIEKKFNWPWLGFTLSPSWPGHLALSRAK